MADIITVEDLPASLQTAEMVQVMVDGLNAKAIRVAPCLSPEPPAEPDPGLLAEAKLILIGVIKRWVEAGSGAITQQSMGPFGMTTDTRQRGGWKLWPSDITDLQDLCRQANENAGKAFTVTLGPAGCSAHQPWCSITWGASCSCGAVLTDGQYPLYEGGEIS